MKAEELKEKDVEDNNYFDRSCPKRLVF